MFKSWRGLLPIFNKWPGRRSQSRPPVFLDKCNRVWQGVNKAELAYETLIDNGRQAAGKDIANYFQLGSDLDALIIDGNSPLMGRSNDKGRLATIIYALDSRAMDGHIKGGEWLVKAGIHINNDEILSAFTKTLCDIY